MTISLSAAELAALCVAAARSAGADDAAADALAAATVAAEQAGNRAVGVAHFFDYLAAYREGRIASGATPEISRPTPGTIVADARKGLAQTAFGTALPDLLAATEQAGIATLWLRNCYTCGELGYYPRELAQRGFLAVACANSPALMALGGSAGPVLGTNPLAYAVPRPGQAPFVIDQATSSTAYVRVREAARAGEPIPAGWAVGPDGTPTTDPAEALGGALLPFGGYRGGNIALLVEILATLAGGTFSVDAPPFDSGEANPGIGVFVLCIDIGAVAGGPDRLLGLLGRLAAEFGVELPAMAAAAAPSSLQLDPALHQRLVAATA